MTTKVKLNGIERLVIEQILPTQGTILEQIAVKEITALVGIKTEEFKIFGLQQNENKQLSWDKNKIKTEKEFAFNEEHIKVLKMGVTLADKEKRVNAQNLELCIKINQLK
jgi:hypothetical protein